MTKKFLTAVGLVFATIIIIICCATIPFKKFELAGGATVKLYLGGKCVYEEVETTEHYVGNKIYSNDYDYSPKRSLITTTLTNTYIGNYKKVNSTYSLIFHSERVQKNIHEDDNFGIYLVKAPSYNYTSDPNLIYASKMAKYFDVDVPLDIVTVNKTGYELYIEVDKKGNIVKHIKKCPDVWFYIGFSSNKPITFDEYLYYYDDNGNLDHYDVSINNPLNRDDPNKHYDNYNKYGDIVSTTLTDNTKYEYEYYDDGSKKSEARYFLGEMQEKTEYFPDGEISSMYKYTVDSGYLYEHDRESKQIKRTNYDKNKNISSVSIYEYNDNGLLVAKKTQSSPYGEFEVVNYTYNIKKYLNGNVKLAEMYVDGVIKSHREYYRSGNIKEEYVYTNGELDSHKTYDQIESDKSLYEEVTENENAKKEYDKKTNTTTVTVYKKMAGNDYPIEIYTFDKNHKVITFESFEYYHEIEVDYRGKSRINVLSEDTVTLEYYNSDNELEHRLYFYATQTGVTIEPEIIK